MMSHGHRPTNSEGRAPRASALLPQRGASCQHRRKISESKERNAAAGKLGRAKLGRAKLGLITATARGDQPERSFVLRSFARRA